MRKIFTAAVMCATALSPIGITPAFAVTPSSTTATTMESTCTSDLGGNATVLLHDGTPAFSTMVENTGSVDGTPIEVADSRVETADTRFGTGTVTFTDLAISGRPYRTGGSVNLFGDQVATHKNFSNSEYDFTADYSTLTTFSYACHVSQETEEFHPAVHIPGRPALGFYIVDPELIDTPQYNAQLQACNAFNAQAPVAPDYKAPGFWGRSPQGNCVFQQTDPAIDPVDELEYYTPGPTLARPDLDTIHMVDETNIAEDVMGHEVNGGPFTLTGNFLAAQVVICISPKKLPGIWTTQNGYSGEDLVGPAAGCNTPYFKVAPYGGGSQTSNGTYISVPGY